jgi:hypothetical protein
VVSRRAEDATISSCDRRPDAGAPCERCSCAPRAASAIVAAATAFAVIDSGTVAAPSHRLHGESIAKAIAVRARARVDPVLRIAR